MVEAVGIAVLGGGCGAGVDVGGDDADAVRTV